MPRLSKQRRLLARNSQAVAEDKVTSIKNVLGFSLGVIVAGITYKKAYLFSVLQNILIPASSTFYKAQSKVGDVLLNMARQSCDYWKNKMEPGATITFDGL